MVSLNQKDVNYFIYKISKDPLTQLIKTTDILFKDGKEYQIISIDVDNRIVNTLKNGKFHVGNKEPSFEYFLNTLVKRYNIIKKYCSYAKENEYIPLFYSTLKDAYNQENLMIY
jgi:hypothetical protein